MPVSVLLRRDSVDSANPVPYIAGRRRGLHETLIREISAGKGEPPWMLRHRLECLRLFQRQSPPSWGPDLSALDLSDVLYYARAEVLETDRWQEIPVEIRRVYERLGIPRAERRVLAGVGAQYESEVIYHRLKEEWKAAGVIFLDMDDALQQYPELVREHFMRVVSPEDHRFAALHGAVWSGGTFLYVPAGVCVTQPLQAYFRMNAPGMGQFEHTLIVVEEGADVHYIEGCSAPKYPSVLLRAGKRHALHAGCVEIFAKPGSKVRYSSVENWSRNTFNLNTKRAIVERDAQMTWVGSNMGSGVTMLYPCSVLTGEGARCDHLGLALADSGQWQDTGAKVLHRAPHTSSTVLSRSIGVRGGRTVYRGLLSVAPDARGAVSSITCEALLLDAASSAETIPEMRVRCDDATVSHEARVGKLSDDDLFYVMSRGLTETQAKAMIVNGFVEPIVHTLPLEYALEMNRLIELTMEGAVG